MTEKESHLAVNRATRTFDEQAESFDRRAGLPSGVSDLIAREFLLLARAGPGDVVLEVGAGTGQIGAALCEHPLRYVGFDSSAAMLDIFRHRCGGNRQPVSLIEADGNSSWPAGDGTIISARATRRAKPSLMASFRWAWGCRPLRSMRSRWAGHRSHKCGSIRISPKS